MPIYDAQNSAPLKPERKTMSKELVASKPLQLLSSQLPHRTPSLPLQMLQRQSPTHFTSTGISPQLQQQFEAQSGFCFSDVRVHYNSGHPAKFCTWAYTRGTQMHLRPGQEQHLPYELGHVVQ